MTFPTLMLLVAVTLAGCSGRWINGTFVADAPAPVVAAVETTCPGGRVDMLKRTTDARVGGRIRNTVVRTNTCLE